MRTGEELCVEQESELILSEGSRGNDYGGDNSDDNNNRSFNGYFNESYDDTSAAKEG